MKRYPETYSFIVTDEGFAALSLISQGMSVPQVAQRLKQDYGIPEKAAVYGVRNFLQKLGGHLR